MPMPGRSFSAGNGYRYGFNGKENDPSISDGAQDYGMRISDNRLGKFFSVDPLTRKYPELTPYQFASNSPIECIDLDGGEGVATTTPTLSNTYIGPGGGVQQGPGGLGTLSPSSASLDANLPGNSTANLNVSGGPKRISYEQMLDLLPPKFASASISKDGNSLLITDINGSTSSRSLLAKPIPVLSAGQQYQNNLVAFKSDTRLSGANVTSSAVEFKKEQPGVEYFYRAMSLTEFGKTGGLIQAKSGDRNDYPFITANLGFLTNKKSFIWEPKSAWKYDLIVRYTVQSGTESYLDNVSIPHGTNVTKDALLSNKPIKKTEAYTIFGGISMPNINFGFPGLSGSGHFNPRITGITIIPIFANGLKDK